MRDALTTQHAAPRAGRKEWLGLAMLALPALIVSMDLTVLHMAAPSISADLAPSSSQMLWVVDIYGFMIAGFLVTMGTLGDRIGRRRLLLIGAAAFGVASALAAVARSPEVLIAARALLGVAGATLAPSTLALLRNMFHDPQQRTTAISVWFMSFMAGAAVGPLVGGALLEHFWWGSAFLVGVPVAVLLLVTGPFLLPESRDPLAGRVDLPSAGLALAAVLLVIYGLKQLAEHGLSTLATVTVVVGLVIAGAFLRRQRSLRTPLVDLTLFSSRPFSAAIAALTLSSVVMGGMGYLVAQYLQLVVGLSPLTAGLWTLPPLCAGIASMAVAPTLARRVGHGAIIAGGLALAGAGFAITSITPDGAGPVGVVLGVAVAFTGLMPVAALGADIVLSSAPPQRAGAASALSETTQELGLALGIALLGSVSTVVYRYRLADVLPAGTPADVEHAARDTLGGATGVADQIPAAALATAQEGFTDGLQLAGTVSAAALGLLALWVGVTLGRAYSRASVHEYPGHDEAGEARVAAADVPGDDAGARPAEASTSPTGG